MVARSSWAGVARVAGMVAIATLAATGAHAQVADTLRPPSPLPPALSIVADTALVPFERPNGMLLRTSTITYDLSIARADSVQPLGARTVQVSEGTVAGAPVWMIVESRTGTLVETTDSLFLSRADLSPVRWVATSGRSQLAAAFTRDTVVGALQSYQGRSAFTVGLGAGTLVTPGMVERVVELLPLGAGYRAGASLLLVELGAPRSVPATISVEREERVRIGEQEADCWVVSVAAGTTLQRLWVTREAPRVVKSEQAFASGLMTAVARP